MQASISKTFITPNDRSHDIPTSKIYLNQSLFEPPPSESIEPALSHGLDPPPSPPSSSPYYSAKDSSSEELSSSTDSLNS